MKHLLMLGPLGVLLAASVSPASAALRYEARQSNNGNFALAYYAEVVTRAQAAAVLADLEKSAEPVDEPGLREVLRKQGVPIDDIKKIVIDAGPNGGEGATILLLMKSSDEKAARSALNDLLGGSGKQKQ